MTLHDVIVRAAADFTAAQLADRALADAEAARVAARDADTSANATATASTAALASVLPADRAFTVDSATVVVLVDGRPSFLPLTDPATVVLPDPEPAPAA
jgi:hypothetical protein